MGYGGMLTLMGAQFGGQLAGQSVLNAQGYKYSRRLQKHAMAWQERMSNTQHQRQVEDLKKAGLNPILSISGGSGAGNFTAPTPVMSGGHAGMPDGSSALQYDLGEKNVKLSTNRLKLDQDIGKKQMELLEAQKQAAQANSAKALAEAKKTEASIPNEQLKNAPAKALTGEGSWLDALKGVGLFGGALGVGYGITTGVGYGIKRIIDKHTRPPKGPKGPGGGSSVKPSSFTYPRRNWNTIKPNWNFKPLDLPKSVPSGSRIKWRSPEFRYRNFEDFKRDVSGDPRSALLLMLMSRGKYKPAGVRIPAYR